VSASTVALGDVADFIRGVTYKPADLVENFSEGSIVCMRTANIQKTLDESSLLSIPRRLVKNDDKMLREGDLLVSTANSWNLVGKCCWVPPLKYAAAAGGFIAALRGDQSKVDPRYLYHWFNSPDTQSDARNCGRQTTNISNMDIGRCLALKIPVPPLPEQRRITAILDKADALRAKRSEAIAKLDQLLQSVFLEMFGDPVTNPKQWPVATVGNCCEKVTVGIVVRPASYYVESGVPAIRSLNIGVNRIVGDDFVYFSEKDNFGPLKKTMLRTGDVVAVRSGQPGKAAVISPEFDGANAIDVLIARTERSVLLPEFLAYFMNSSAGKKLVLKEQRGQVQKHLNVKQLSEAEIPLPPLKEQKRFIIFARAAGELEKNLKAASSKFDALFAGIQSRTFSGAL